MVVTLSHHGYIKSQQLSAYRTQHRGGRGIAATAIRDEDFVEKLFVANSHDTLLSFSNRGRIYWIKVYKVPQASRTARGRPLVNLLPLVDGERITAVLPVKEFVDDRYVFMATRFGTVKKTPLRDYSHPRPSGIIAVDLAEGDSLVGVALTDGTRDVMLFSSAGKAARFEESEVRPMGRTAHGVRGIRLGEGQHVIALIPVDPDRHVLVATQNGYGKRTPVDEFPRHGRGGQGVIAMQTTARTGQVIAAVAVAESEEIMLISDGGTLVRTPVSEVSVIGRNTQGVRLINLSDGETLVSVEPVADSGESAEVAAVDGADVVDSTDVPAVEGGDAPPAE
jgi:DNA gyrase subunit A